MYKRLELISKKEIIEQIMKYTRNERRKKIERGKH